MDRNLSRKELQTPSIDALQNAVQTGPKLELLVFLLGTFVLLVLENENIYCSTSKTPL